MPKALSTLGAKTSHGGVVTEVESSFTINDIAVHLAGMKHFCPKCKSVAAAAERDQARCAVQVQPS